MTVKVGLCRTWSETTLLVFPRGGSVGTQELLPVHIPLIGKDGDDVIDNITCELTGTESIKTQI